MKQHRQEFRHLQFKSSHQRKRRSKSPISLLVLLGIVFMTLLVFIIPQFHFEKIINDHGILWLDILQHIFFFFFLTLILFRLLPFQKLTFSFFLFIFLFSAFFELLQKLLYEINFSYKDTASNFIGIALAFLIYKFAAYRKMKPRKRKHLRQTEDNSSE